MGKKIRAEKGGRGIESNVIEEYTPLVRHQQFFTQIMKKPFISLGDQRNHK